MRRILLSILIPLVAVTASQAQTAMNFTATDCDGNSHTLFTELDNGKVIVLTWIMPCAVCISDAKAAYDAVQSMAAAHPGRVVNYLVDDLGNTTCGDMTAWAMANGVDWHNGNLFTFQNAGRPINEDDYGGIAMPHVLVLGGSNHKVFLNIKDGSNDRVVIENAIADALNPTAVPEVAARTGTVNLFPNPASGYVMLSYSLARSGTVSADIFDIRGIKVKSITEQQASGTHTFRIDLDHTLAAGYYQVRLNADGRSLSAGFLISR